MDSVTGHPDVPALKSGPSPRPEVRARQHAAARRRAVVPVLLVSMLTTVVGLLALPGASTAADPGEWTVTSLEVDALVESDGIARVTWDIRLDLGSDGGVGPVITLPERRTLAADPHHEAVLSYAELSASSRTGAPTDIAAESRDGRLTLRVGRPDSPVTGEHQYTISWTVSGLTDPGTARGDELAWDALIDGALSSRIDSASIRMTGPAAILSATCQRDGHGDCPGLAIHETEVEITEKRLGAEEGLTVSVVWPTGTLEATAEPRLVSRRDLVSLVQPSMLTIGGSVGLSLLLAGGLAAWILRRRSAAARAIGTVPGLRTADDGQEVTAKPPSGVAPGVVSALLGVGGDSGAMATILDLADRGGLTVEARGPVAQQDQCGWRLSRLGGATGQRAQDYEAALLEALFEDGEEVVLPRDQERWRRALTVTRIDLEAAAIHRGLLTVPPSRQRLSWALVGTGLIVLSAAAVAGLIAAGMSILWALPPLALGAAAVSAGFLLPVRSADGERLRHQAIAYRRYLESLGDQDPEPRGRWRLEEHLVWAAAMGCADRLLDAYRRSGGEAQSQGLPAWLVGESASVEALEALVGLAGPRSSWADRLRPRHRPA